MSHATMTSASAACHSKKALLGGLRPNSSSTQKIQCGVCPTCCIYCDIWKLATLIYSHVSSSRKSSSTSSPICRSDSSSSSGSSSSRRSNDYAGWEVNEKALAASFQTQKARLASILSICTVEGADESEGLRMAHDRCLLSVTDLIVKQKTLQEHVLRRSIKSERGSLREAYRSEWNRDCSSSHRYMSRECESRMVGMAS